MHFIDVMNIEMKRDFNKIVTLMRKAYSETLQDGEQEEFEEVLENKALRDVYSEIGDDDYLEKHFARYEKFSPEKAYETFRLNQRKSRFRLRLVLFCRYWVRVCGCCYRKNKWKVRLYWRKRRMCS